MASTYTTNSGIEKIASGEQNATWGDTTNTNWDIVDVLVGGGLVETLPAVGTSGAPNDIAVTDGAVSDGQNAFISFADGGDLGGTAYVRLTPNNAERVIWVQNNLSGSQSINVFQGTYDASNDIRVPAGQSACVYFDGAGAGAVVSQINSNIMGLTIGTDVQAYDADLTAIAGLAKTNSNFIVGNGTTWVAETGATARTSLGLTIGTDVQAWNTKLDDIADLTPTDSNIIVGNGTTWVAETGATARTTLGLGTMAVAATSDYAALAGATFTDNVTIQDNVPRFILYETDAPTDRKYCTLDASSGVFRIRMYDDAFSSFVSPLGITRNGMTVTDFDVIANDSSFSGDVEIEGSLGIGDVSPTSPVHVLTAASFDAGDYSDNRKGAIFSQMSVSNEGIGNYGPGIGFGGANGTSRRRAGIASYQSTSDADQTGLAFFTYASTSSGSNGGTESMLLDESGNLSFIGGLVVGAPTGGNKGTGTINATNYYKNNVQLATETFVTSDYAALAGATFTGAITARPATGSVTTGTMTVAGNANKQVTATRGLTMPNAIFTAGDSGLVRAGASARTITRGASVTMYVNGTNSATATLTARGVMGFNWESSSVVYLTGDIS